ncbi:MAG: site-specific tyrosine recombinase XerD [Candidatus Ozemobacteraceae bacterium]
MQADLLEQHLAYLAVDRGLRPKSLEAYRCDLEDFLVFLDERGRRADETSIEGPLVMFMVTLHERGLSPRSIARKASAIKGFYRFLMREGRLTADPSKVIERPKPGRPLPKVLSLGEIERLIAATTGETPLHLRDRAILETLYGTGIRESELIDLQLGSIHREGEFINVIGKGNRERVIPIGTYALLAIDRYLAQGRPKLLADITIRTLFLNPQGKPLSRMGVWKIVRKYAVAAGITHPVSPHVLRHSCATHMLEGGADIIAIQEMLGHVDVSTTQIYTHLTGQDLKRIHTKAHPRAK